MFRTLLLAIPLVALTTVARPAVAADEEHPVVTLIKSKVKDQKKPFALLVTFKAKAGNEKAIEEAFAPCLIATRKEPGCVAYILNRDTEDPTNYIMYEQFKSIDALAAHMKQKHTETLLKTLGTLTDGDPKLKVLSLPE
jgi:quinol monooxygenase YgiN